MLPIRLSVIIPAYNAEKTISHCVESVLKAAAQNDEVIVIDDGSSDDTIDILKKISDSRLVVISQNNSGVSAARNHGLQLMRGEYVAFVDADDYINHTLFDDLFCKMDGNTDIVISGYSMISKEGNIVYSNVDRLSGFAGTITPREIALKYFQLFSASAINTCWGKLFRKTVIGTEGFNTVLRIGEDASFNLMAYKRSRNIMIEPVGGYFYCQSDTQSTRKRIPALSDILVTHFSDIDSFLRFYDAYGTLTVREGMGFCWGNTVLDYALDYCTDIKFKATLHTFYDCPWSQYIIQAEKDFPAFKRALIRMFCSKQFFPLQVSTHAAMWVKNLRNITRKEKTLC
ncbi:MAG: glycosyltransferase family A protein [Parabacteroides sp.]|nr:glycosyltransferase family A protein [Parabacteroides sp.]